MGIPAVVGTKFGTSILKTGQVVTVNANDGEVLAGKVEGLKSGYSFEQLSVLPTGEVVNDFLNAISVAFNDVTEIWPLSPAQLFSYFDVDQALDMMDKLKQLKKEGKSIEEIARLFERPHPVRSFLLNVGVIGLKVAHVFKIGQVSKDDLDDFMNTFKDILDVLSFGDAFCLGGTNRIWNEDQTLDFVHSVRWSDVKEVDKRLLSQLSAELLPFIVTGKQQRITAAR